MTYGGYRLRQALIPGVVKDASAWKVLESPHANELRDCFTRALANEIPFVLP